MPPEAAEPKRWVDKAGRDLRTAEAALGQTPPITDTAAFHAQQAVEKLLKGYLVWRGEPFERTHDLEPLCELCAKHDPAFEALTTSVARLTAYAVRFRYPGPAEPTPEQVWAALQTVRAVWELVLDRLPRDQGADA